MGICGLKYGSSKFTQVEAIDHLSNYFKHHSEWRDKKPHNSTKRTNQAVTEMRLNINRALWFSRNLSAAIKGGGYKTERVIKSNDHN
jgi:hypothetical protein